MLKDRTIEEISKEFLDWVNTDVGKTDEQPDAEESVGTRFVPEGRVVVLGRSSHGDGEYKNVRFHLAYPHTVNATMRIVTSKGEVYEAPFVSASPEDTRGDIDLFDLVVEALGIDREHLILHEYASESECVDADCDEEDPIVHFEYSHAKAVSAPAEMAREIIKKTGAYLLMEADVHEDMTHSSESVRVVYPMQVVDGFSVGGAWGSSKSKSVRIKNAQWDFREDEGLSFYGIDARGCALFRTINHVEEITDERRDEQGSPQWGVHLIDWLLARMRDQPSDYRSHIRARTFQEIKKIIEDKKRNSGEKHLHEMIVQVVGVKASFIPMKELFAGAQIEKRVRLFDHEASNHTSSPYNEMPTIFYALVR